MKVICIVTCALAACAVAASAASIEQVLNIKVTGLYQGVSTNSPLNRSVELERTQVFSITSANIVRALAIDSGATYSNYFNGTLIYRTATNGSTTNVVIRRAPFPDLDVTSHFGFTPGPGPIVVSQVSNTNTTPILTTTRIETGLMALSFTSSSVSFNTNNAAFSYGTSTRTHNPVTGRVKDTNGVVVPVSGYANLLSYSGGGGIASLNTNLYNFKTNQFAATNFVSGPVQIQFSTFGPVISTNDPIVAPD